ncbi:MAG: methyltransferase domain-containing protein [Spartobacteria bacterium]|nr:methyltransferase domain-containing protein [Spartobacteria bacterium]
MAGDRMDTMNKEQHINIQPWQNPMYHLLGAGTQMLKKLRQRCRPGYNSPRGISIHDYARVIDYDLDVTARWLHYLRRFNHDRGLVPGQAVLEVGPGADLGNGLILLAGGASAYTGFDMNPLASDTPDALYEALIARLASQEMEADPSIVEQACRDFQQGNPSPLSYVVDPSFSFDDLPSGHVDLIFSHAAFEHIPDIPLLAKHLYRVSKPEAILVAYIDLKTHHGFLAKRDPLNMYRYGPRFYRMFSYPGSPNRVRPREYEAAFREAGWSDAIVYPDVEFNREYVDAVCPALASAYQAERADMRLGGVVLCVRK